MELAKENASEIEKNAVDEKEYGQARKLFDDIFQSRTDFPRILTPEPTIRVTCDALGNNLKDPGFGLTWKRNSQFLDFDLPVKPDRIQLPNFRAFSN